MAHSVYFARYGVAVDVVVVDLPQTPEDDLRDTRAVRV